MKDATHISPCGRWHYKVRKNPMYNENHLFRRNKIIADFWDVHCNKWRESCLGVCDRHMIKIKND